MKALGDRFLGGLFAAYGVPLLAEEEHLYLQNGVTSRGNREFKQARQLGFNLAQLVAAQGFAVRSDNKFTLISDRLGELNMGPLALALVPLALLYHDHTPLRAQVLMKLPFWRLLNPQTQAELFAWCDLIAQILNNQYADQFQQLNRQAMGLGPRAKSDRLNSTLGLKEQPALTEFYRHFQQKISQTHLDFQNPHFSPVLAACGAFLQFPQQLPAMVQVTSHHPEAPFLAMVLTTVLFGLENGYGRLPLPWRVQGQKHLDIQFSPLAQSFLTHWAGIQQPDRHQWDQAAIAALQVLQPRKALKIMSHPEHS